MYPAAIVADVDILKDAPMPMLTAGFGDIIGKFTSLADWRLSHQLNGEYYCPEVAGVIAIGVNSGAYIAEIVRGAIQSIDKGQTEAGRSTGLTQAQTMLYIIWPQAFRRMIPPLTNQCIISLKDTSLLVVIGVGELTRQGQEIIAVNFRAFEVWLTVAIFYLAMTLSISAVLRYYERKLMIGRRAVPASPSDPQM